MAAVHPEQTIEPKLVCLKKVWDEQEKLYQTINKIQSKLSRMSIKKAEKFDDKFWKRLITLNEKAQILAEKESTLCLEIEGFITAQASDKSDTPTTVLNISGNSNKGSGISKQVPSPELLSRNPSLCSVILVGDEVAAKVSSEGDETDVWIVVRVIKVVEEALLFHVRDEIPDDVDGKTAMRDYVLPQTCILPFQQEASGSDGTFHLRGSHVLAVYPGTSTLYKATVVGRDPADGAQVHHYLLEFDGDETLEEGVDKLPVRRVLFDGVVPLPQGHRQ